MPLEEEEQKHVTAAEGFLMLGMLTDADAELDRIDPFCRHLPEVLEVRAKIYAALRKWELLQVVAKRLYDCTESPEWAAEWAVALKNCGAMESAKVVLLDAIESHPDCAMLHYVLACCESASGDTEVAKVRLQHALKLNPELRIKALDEPELNAIFA